jgi:hypothetical protein
MPSMRRLLAAACALLLCSTLILTVGATSIESGSDEIAQVSG